MSDFTLGYIKDEIRQGETVMYIGAILFGHHTNDKPFDQRNNSFHQSATLNM